MIQSTPVTRARPYRPGRRRPPGGRRDALLRHGLPIVAIALVAFAVGAVLGGTHRAAEQDLADRFTRAWEKADYAAMHGMLTTEARDRVSRAAFADAYRRAAATATATALKAGEARGPRDGAVPVGVVVRTRVFGTVRATLSLPVTEEDGEPRVDWAEHLTFPGVRRGERLERTTRLPTRAPLLAADGTRLAAGPDRASEDPELAASIVGEMGPIPEERARELRAAGVPADADVGLGGLERALDDELRGRPGGELRAGDRVLASRVAAPAGPVRTSIAPGVQRAASAALAGRLGGIVALDPRTGRVLGAAGIGLSGLQPPGSTFKIITLSGALEAGITRPRESFPVSTAATLEGVRLENANGESCGGTLIESFAHSCNSVFAPLGAELGARRLVGVAERFGFNRAPGIDGAAESSIPPAAEIGDDLAVGSSAIGQGRVQSTALAMAIAAATIAERGRRPLPTLLARARPRHERAIPPRVARVVARGMRDVVRYGTGTAAALPGTTVAGKTGTAELRSTQTPQPGGTAVAPEPAADPTDTTAWFAAYAPAGRPRVAVALFLVGSGAGGQTAAPAVKPVLQAGLARRRG